MTKIDIEVLSVFFSYGFSRGLAYGGDTDLSPYDLIATERKEFEEFREDYIAYGESQQR